MMNFVACVASVSVWFPSKERPRNGIFGFGRARNERDGYAVLTVRLVQPPEIEPVT